MKKTLPDDPRAALKALAEYINGMKLTEENTVPAGGNPRGCLGFWLSCTYLQNLRGLASEAERVAKLK